MQESHRQLLRATSRTFALSIERLPGLVRDALCLGYLMLRVSDYLEDNGDMHAERKVELLELWADILSGKKPASLLAQALAGGSATEDEPDLAAAHACAEIYEQVESLPRALRQPLLDHVRNSTLGMARWLARGPNVRDEADMDDYMHEVAGRVGYLVTDVFVWYSRAASRRAEKLKLLAHEFGLALQTVNIIRGLRKDYERGWIYVPETFCAAANISRQDLFKPERRAEAMVVVNILAQKAERHLQNALLYVEALPRWPLSLRLACIWPMLFAARTVALSRDDARVLLGEVKVARGEILSMVRKSTVFGWSNVWLKRYFRQLCGRSVSASENQLGSATTPSQSGR